MASESAPVSLPRVAITYCTQCRWMLRAAYFAQELLSTFSTQIGEIALIPATGGVFTVVLTYKSMEDELARTQTIWDRKAEGGFPETKVLKQLIRDCIDPTKDLGHSDRHGKKKDGSDGTSGKQDPATINEGDIEKGTDGTICEDCT